MSRAPPFNIELIFPSTSTFSSCAFALFHAHVANECIALECLMAKSQDRTGGHKREMENFLNENQ